MLDNLISVIIPVYKVENYLNRCINSIVNQTYKNLDIILIDDGSPDNCPQICDDWAEKDGRIHVIHKSNGGLSDARNAGLKASKGEYIFFLDSDDYIDLRTIEIMLHELQQTNADLVLCNTEYVTENQEVIQKQSPIKHERLSRIEAIKKLHQDNWPYYVTAWNKLYSRKALLGIEFPVGKLHEDLFVAHRVFYNCDNITVIEDKLYYYVQRKNSIMSSSNIVSHFDAVEAMTSRYWFYKEKKIVEHFENCFEMALKEKIYYQAYLRNIFENNTCSRLAEINKLLRDVYIDMQSSTLVDKMQSFISLSLVSDMYKIFQRKFNLKARFKLVKELIAYLVKSFRYKFILLDTPTHGNLGDHAIVMAEQQFLDRYRSENKYLELTAAEINHRERWYARLTPMNRVILVPGGGFLGALWPDEEYRFRRILKAFSKHSVIVFPQTVTFDMETEEGRAFFEESKCVYESHPNLTVFVREKKSEEFMRTYLPRIPCVLVPDIVTIMEADIPKHVRNGILFCMRKDVEKNISQDELNMLIGTVKRHYPDEKIDFTDTVVDYMIQPKDREREVLSKLEQFSKAKLVITDRLHGMIFAALTNTPCIAFSNSNGKVGAVYEWIKYNEYIIYLDTIDAVEDALNSLDLNRTYSYRRDAVLRAFEPLIQLMEVKK